MQYFYDFVKEFTFPSLVVFFMCYLLACILQNNLKFLNERQHPSFKFYTPTVDRKVSFVIALSLGLISVLFSGQMSLYTAQKNYSKPVYTATHQIADVRRLNEDIFEMCLFSAKGSDRGNLSVDVIRACTDAATIQKSEPKYKPPIYGGAYVYLNLTEENSHEINQLHPS